MKGRLGSFASTLLAWQSEPLDKTLQHWVSQTPEGQVQHVLSAKNPAIPAALRADLEAARRRLGMGALLAAAALVFAAILPLQLGPGPGAALPTALPGALLVLSRYRVWRNARRAAQDSLGGPDTETIRTVVLTAAPGEKLTPMLAAAATAATPAVPAAAGVVWEFLGELRAAAGSEDRTTRRDHAARKLLTDLHHHGATLDQYTLAELGLTARPAPALPAVLPLLAVEQASAVATPAVGPEQATEPQTTAPQATPDSEPALTGRIPQTWHGLTHSGGSGGATGAPAGTLGRSYRALAKGLTLDGGTIPLLLAIGKILVLLPVLGLIALIILLSTLSAVTGNNHPAPTPTQAASASPALGGGPRHTLTDLARQFEQDARTYDLAADAALAHVAVAAPADRRAACDAARAAVQPASTQLLRSAANVSLVTDTAAVVTAVTAKLDKCADTVAQPDPQMVSLIDQARAATRTWDSRLPPESPARMGNQDDLLTLLRARCAR